MGVIWDSDAFGEALRKASRAGRLPWAALHFRHTFGSHLAMKGESLYKISQLLGNSPEVCRRHYAALLPESLVDSVEFDTRPQPVRSNLIGGPGNIGPGAAPVSVPGGWRVVGFDR